MKGMKICFSRCILAVIILFSYCYKASACSCSWEGPFMVVAKNSPLVVRGKIIRHHPDKSPTMSVLVLETLKGGLLDSGLVVQMGDGMHCRPTLDAFPPGSEWILALNGPGSKPGQGFALSHCGEFWLRVSNDEVTGSIDGNRGQVKRMSLGEFRQRFLYPRFVAHFSGEVRHGERFQYPFGYRFSFILQPISSGWEILIQEYGRDENLARLTPPLHFAPNPREIEGWHFLKDPSMCPDRPYQAEAGPAEPRQFFFSPEVGLTIQGREASAPVTPEDLDRVKRFGRGQLSIEHVLLQRGAKCPKLERMKFSVYLEGGY